MKRTLLTVIPEHFPEDVRSFIGKSPIFDSSCSKEARVYFIDKDSGYYLKSSAIGSLEREALMADYFHKKGLSSEVLRYESKEGADWLLTASVTGEDLTHQMHLDDPKRLSALLGERLRLLHETDFSDCPVRNRVKEYLSIVEENYRTGNYDKTAFPDSFGYKSADEAYRVVSCGKHLLKNDTLIHGDYCLPNIMLDNWSFSGFIDLGNAGVGDRHIDLFWGAWTLWFNLRTNDYRERFFDAYGRDKIDNNILKTVAACEVFG